MLRIGQRWNSPLVCSSSCSMGNSRAASQQGGMRGKILELLKTTSVGIYGGKVICFFLSVEFNWISGWFFCFFFSCWDTLGGVWAIASTFKQKQNKTTCKQTVLSSWGSRRVLDSSQNNICHSPSSLHSQRTQRSFSFWILAPEDMKVAYEVVWIKGARPFLCCRELITKLHH